MKVDSERAAEVLAEATARAADRAYDIPRAMETKIEQIIGHTHLTYKYILLNGMLAKATNPGANPLVLQAGAPLDGAFDARSLCHSVVVPFEQTTLERRLGGSNEPFLNKPARFTHLSLDNAVRRGKDRATLEHLIDVFGMVNVNRNADQALVSVLAHILSLESRAISFDAERFKAQASKRGVLSFLDKLWGQSCEGETLALGVAVVFELFLQGTGAGRIVVSHPTNQSGSSSNEISDVDVFESDGKTPAYCCEVKDKPFAKADVDHAISKVAQSDHYSMLFVYGPNAKTLDDLKALVLENEAKGFDLTFMSAEAFAVSLISLAPSVSWAEIASHVNKHLTTMRAKEATISHCKALLASV